MQSLENLVQTLRTWAGSEDKSHACAVKTGREGTMGRREGPQGGDRIEWEDDHTSGPKEKKEK